MEKVVDIMATQAQREFLAALEDEWVTQVGFGGARGGGKTYISCLAMIIRRLRYPGTKGLILRKTQKSVDANIGDEIRRILIKIGMPIGRGAAQYIKSGGSRWVLPNGSSIVLGYCRTGNDWEQYQGVQYTDIVFEEATQFPEKAYLDIIGSHRAEVPGVSGKIWITCNPGGIGTAWVERRFINPDTRDQKTVWVKSLVRDNKAMLVHDPEYRDRVLGKQPEWRRRQWEDGDWGSIEGAYWEFDPSKVVVEVSLPEHADIHAGIDEGFFPSPYAVVWAASWREWPSGKHRIHVFAETKEYRLDTNQQAIHTIRRERSILDGTGMTVKSRWADPTAWKRTGNGCTSEVWINNGMMVNPAFTNARVPGWKMIRSMLEDGTITISPKCGQLLKEFEAGSHDMTTEDMLKECEDHLLDALRYMVVSIFRGRYQSQQNDDPYVPSSTNRLRSTR